MGSWIFLLNERKPIPVFGCSRGAKPGWWRASTHWHLCSASHPPLSTSPTFGTGCSLVYLLGFLPRPGISLLTKSSWFLLMTFDGPDVGTRSATATEPLCLCVRSPGHRPVQHHSGLLPLSTPYSCEGSPTQNPGSPKHQRKFRKSYQTHLLGPVPHPRRSLASVPS